MAELLEYKRLRTEFERLTAELERLTRVLTAETQLERKAKPCLATLTEETRRLAGRDASIGVPPGHTGRSVLTEKEQSHLNALPHAAVAPFLIEHIKTWRGMCGSQCGHVLVLNNKKEGLPLPISVDVEGAAGAELKPDLLLTWRPFLKPTGGGPSAECQHGLLEGTLASPILQLDMYAPELYLMKELSFGDRPLGQLILYHKQLPGNCNSMLLSRTGFTLYRSRAGVPLRLIERVPWTEAGSLQTLEPGGPLVSMLRALASECTDGPAWEGGCSPGSLSPRRPFPGRGWQWPCLRCQEQGWQVPSSEGNCKATWGWGLLSASLQLRAG